jgi:hypothetical protein
VTRTSTMLDSVCASIAVEEKAICALYWFSVESKRIHNSSNL